MTDTNVHALNGANLDSDRRRDFLNHIFHAYDTYVQLTGLEPDALVVVMGGVKQPSRVNWLMQGESRGASTSMLALAHAVIGKEIYNPIGDE